MAAQTEELIENGGFESGISGWTLSGATDYTGLNVASHSGSGEFHAGSVGADSHLSQSIATSEGQLYGIDFWLANEGGPENDFNVSWNGNTLLSLSNAGEQGYTKYHFDVQGQDGNSELEFSFRQDPAWWDLDDVSVIGNGIRNLSDEESSFANGVTDSGTLPSRRPALAMQDFVNSHFDDYAAAVNNLSQNSSIQNLANNIAQAGVGPGQFLSGAITAGIGGAVLSEAAAIGGAIAIGTFGAEVLGAALVIGGVATAYAGITGNSGPANYLENHLRGAINTITTSINQQ